MADQEVVKHTKKVYKIWSSKEHTLWHKIKEFVIEIFIIVFAVSLSIWLHDKSEHSHQQKVVKEFLLGLKVDLQNDIKEMGQDRANYAGSKQAFKYLRNASQSNNIDNDSLKFYTKWIFNSVQLVPNDGRYEGFKSSGNIGNIENPELQSNVVDFYQEDIKTLLFTSSYYAARKDKFFDFYLDNLKKVKDSSNMIPLILSDVGRNYVNTLGQIDEILDRYDTCINRATKIIALIEHEYK